MIDNEHSVARVYKEFSWLKSSVEYERNYFEISAKEEGYEKYRYAVIADTGEVLYPKNVKNDVIFLANNETYDFNRVPNSFLLDAKIKGVKAKMNENFDKAVDDYYLNDHHSKVYEYVGSLQNRFYRSLSAAICEWVFWRVYETVSPYMNMEIVFQKIEALYISAYSDDLLDDSKMSYDIGYYNRQAKKLGLSEDISVEIRAISNIFYYIEQVYRRTYNGSKIVSVVVFARLVLSGAKKKLFNEWLDDILAKARPLFEIDFYPSWYKAYYDSTTDDFVPREFFFDKNYQYTPESGEKLKTEFVEKIKKEGNYFLNIEK